MLDCITDWELPVSESDSPATSRGFRLCVCDLSERGVLGCEEANGAILADGQDRASLMFPAFYLALEPPRTMAAVVEDSVGQEVSAGVVQRATAACSSPVWLSLEWSFRPP